MECENGRFQELNECVMHDHIRNDAMYNKGLRMLRYCMGDYGCVLHMEDVRYYLLCNNINIC